MRRRSVAREREVGVDQVVGVIAALDVAQAAERVWVEEQLGAGGTAREVGEAAAGRPG
jgi:hypothetical protein